MAFSGVSTVRAKFKSPLFPKLLLTETPPSRPVLSCNMDCQYRYEWVQYILYAEVVFRFSSRWYLRAGEPEANGRGEQEEKSSEPVWNPVKIGRVVYHHM